MKQVFAIVISFLMLASIAFLATLPSDNVGADIDMVKANNVAMHSGARIIEESEDKTGWESPGYGDALYGLPQVSPGHEMAGETYENPGYGDALYGLPHVGEAHPEKTYENPGYGESLYGLPHATSVHGKGE